MLFLNAGFWLLFWAVIGGGAVVTGLLSLLVATVAQPHRQPVPVTAAATTRQDEAAQPMRAA